MAQHNERRNNPKLLKNPRTIYHNPKRLRHGVYYTPSFAHLQEKEGVRKATAQHKTKPSVLSNPTLLLRRKQARTSPSFYTCEEKEGVNGCTGKAPQRVNARITHMHREHSSYSNPTSPLQSPFVQHKADSLSWLCRARKVRTHTTNERSGDNPSLLRNKQHEDNAYVCHHSNISERRVVRRLCCMAICFILSV